MVSFGLSLYQFGQRRPAPVVADWPARPAGRLIWLIAPGPDEADAMVQLARLIREEDGHGVLLSVPPEQLAGFHEFAGELAEAIAPEAVLDWCHAQRQAAA